ncbi:MAG TPA: hypothetical protein VE130_09660 [Nitrososphaeraceae archaeon]|jgi:hypothetical protein|nr:hypothetical protein [Nitrososphaeraceae archaeon]
MLDEELGDVPAGTVLCSFNGLGEQTVQIAETQEDISVFIEELPPTAGCLTSEGHASSGTPPEPLEIGDSVCVTEL